MNRSVNQLSDIVDNGLCIGCGLCQSIAGKDKIEISMTSKGRLEPKEISKITPEIFEKIRNVCPGTIVEGLPKENVDQSAKHNLVWGYYLSLCYTWSTDKKIRLQNPFDLKNNNSFSEIYSSYGEEFHLIPFLQIQ